MVWFLVFPRYPFPQKHYAPPHRPQHPHNPLHRPPHPLSIPSVTPTLPHTLHPPLIHDPVHINLGSPRPEYTFYKPPHQTHPYHAAPASRRRQQRD